MRGFRIGAIASGALAAISLGITQSLDFRTRKDRRSADEAMPPHVHRGHPRKFDWNPMGKSAQEPQLERLTLDRSSNIKKINRWTRSGKLTPPSADARAINRHKVRRAEIQRAKNYETLGKQG